MVKEAVSYFNNLQRLWLSEENIFIIAQELERFFKYFVKSEYIQAETDLLIVPETAENDRQEVFIKALVKVSRQTARTEEIDYCFHLQRLDLDEFLDEMRQQQKVIESGLKVDFMG